MQQRAISLSRILSGITLILALVGNGYAEQETATLICTLDGSDDQFHFFPQQLIYHSQSYLVFQNFEGSVVTSVEIGSGRFARVSHIGEPFAPQIQLLTGHCKSTYKSSPLRQPKAV